jgi:hypothetical protein
MVVTGNEGTLVLFVRGNDDVTAILDGSVVPADRIVREGDRLRVVSTTGQTLFDVRVVSAGADALSAGSRAYALAGPERDAFWGSLADVHVAGSRKLIGVTTTPVDAALSAQLGIDAEQAFVINEVNAGMPAEKAGMKPWDVVVKIDGEGPGTVERLREVLHEKQEGQTVRLSILRKGEPMELDVGFTASKGGFVSGMPGDLTRYKLGELDPAEGLGVRGALQSAMAEREREIAALREALDTARVQLEVSVVALADAEAAARGPGAGDVDEARLKQLRAEVERAQRQAASAADRFGAARMGAGFLDLGTDGGRALFVPPAYAGAGSGPRSDDHARGLAQMEERLAQMQDRLARLEVLLNKLVESGQGR